MRKRLLKFVLVTRRKLIVKQTRKTVQEKVVDITQSRVKFMIQM